MKKNMVIALLIFCPIVLAEKTIFSSLEKKIKINPEMYSPGEYSFYVKKKNYNVEKVSQLMRSICTKQYGGELRAIEDDTFLVGIDVSDERLGALAGRDGPLKDYINEKINRPVAGLVIKRNGDIMNSITTAHPEIKKLILLYQGACVGYLEGILTIHFAAILLGKETLWAVKPMFVGVNEEVRFKEGIAQELRVARTAALKQMYADKNHVSHYSGEDRIQKLEMKYEFLDDMENNAFYRINMSFKYKGKKTVSFPADLFSTLTISSRPAITFTPIDVKKKNGGELCLHSPGANKINFQGGANCEFDFIIQAGEFDYPNVLLRTKSRQWPLELLPVSVFEKRFEHTAQGVEN